MWSSKIPYVPAAEEALTNTWRCEMKLARRCLPCSLYLQQKHGRCAVGHTHTWYMVDRMLGWFGVCVRAAQNCVLCCGEVLLLVLNQLRRRDADLLGCVCQHYRKHTHKTVCQHIIRRKTICAWPRFISTARRHILYWAKAIRNINEKNQNERFFATKNHFFFGKALVMYFK